MPGAKAAPRKGSSSPHVPSLKKSPTGMQGLDDITGGGLPKGRPTFVFGNAGCGKTLLSMEFLVCGALQYDEPGLFVAFEETPEELAQNVASLGFDLDKLIKQKKLAMDYVHIDPSEISETGDYDLEGLFIRLNHAIDSIGAKRVVLDTLEALFSGLSNTSILRAELRRLFRWLKDKGVTAIITGERNPDDTTSRHGLEEYVSDCVILLDHRVHDQISTRRLRVIKYRGTRHGTNEYPFLIEEKGISVLPVTSMKLDYPTSSERITTGVARLDDMMQGKGFYRGSSILLSGSAGAGKTSFTSHFVNAVCKRGERCLFFSFDESEGQVIRNMHSIGIDLQPWIKKGLLRFHVARPMVHGLEQHLLSIQRLTDDFDPAAVIIDPVSSLISAGTPYDTQVMVTRLIDFFKSKGITAYFTSLTTTGGTLEREEIAISSLADSWLMLDTMQIGGERRHRLQILKSRGMAHSSHVHWYRLTAKGIDILDSGSRDPFYNIAADTPNAIPQTRVADQQKRVKHSARAKGISSSIKQRIKKAQEK